MPGHNEGLEAVYCQKWTPENKNIPTEGIEPLSSSEILHRQEIKNKGDQKVNESITGLTTDFKQSEEDLNGPYNYPHGSDKQHMEVLGKRKAKELQKGLNRTKNRNSDIKYEVHN